MRSLNNHIVLESGKGSGKPRKAINDPPGRRWSCSTHVKMHTREVAVEVNRAMRGTDLKIPEPETANEILADRPEEKESGRMNTRIGCSLDL